MWILCYQITNQEYFNGTKLQRSNTEGIVHGHTNPIKLRYFQKTRRKAVIRDGLNAFVFRPGCGNLHTRHVAYKYRVTWSDQSKQNRVLHLQLWCLIETSVWSMFILQLHQELESLVCVFITESDLKYVYCFYFIAYT